MILELRRVRQEDCAFEAILDYIAGASLRRTRIRERPWGTS